MIQIQKINRPDTIGALASSLCAIHCMATPFIFLAGAHAMAHAADAPLWWRLIDYFFLVVSFLAIYAATRNTNRNWVKVALFVSWGVLSLAILNETFEIAELDEAVVYIPGFSMTVLHLYNQRYCKCTGDGCCVDD